jgi:hypothetical protein
MRKHVKALGTLTIMMVMGTFGARDIYSYEEGLSKRDDMGDSLPEGSKTDRKTLNARLERQWYPTFLDNFFSLDGGRYKILNWVVSGGEGHGSLRREALTTTGSYKVSLSGGYGFLNVEYLVYSMESLSVYPLLEVGGRMRFKLIERLGEVLPFEVLENPKTGGFLVNAALGADGLLKLREDEKGKGGFVTCFPLPLCWG